MSSFPGMGSMGGNGLPGGARQVDNEKLYKLLEIERNASETEIRKAYKEMARKHHPDKKGGSAEKFREISRAHDVLSDPKKRRIYDELGEEGLENGGPVGPDFPDFVPRRRRTKDVVQPLKVSLEEMYGGCTKKMRVTRSVVDKDKGVTTCQHCSGRGVKLETVRLGPMIQQVQSPCGSCGGQGKCFHTKEEREVLEVHVQRGAHDGQRVVFHGKADEHPGAETGDVVFVLQQRDHAEFRRKGADLYLERTISLVEALCGFEIEVRHLDGRRLLVRTAPGELTRPAAHGFDPLSVEEAKAEWEVFDDADCESIDTVAQAGGEDPEVLKRVCETQLKRQGLDVGCFVVRNGRAFFKEATREQALAAKTAKRGSTMYVLADPSAKAGERMMKAVKGEGMPTVKNPFVHGNLFLVLTIQFPDALAPDQQAGLRALLPPPLNRPTCSPSDEGVEVHDLVDVDPVTSYNQNKANMQAGGEAYDEDEEGGGSGSGCPPQCQQM